MHALICCLHISLAKLGAPPAAASNALNSSAVDPQQSDEKQQSIRVLLKMLSQVREIFMFQFQILTSLSGAL
jgi:hypothetical protein